MSPSPLLRVTDIYYGLNYVVFLWLKAFSLPTLELDLRVTVSTNISAWCPQPRQLTDKPQASSFRGPL